MDDETYRKTADECQASALYQVIDADPLALDNTHPAAMWLKQFSIHNKRERCIATGHST